MYEIIIPKEESLKLYAALKKDRLIRDLWLLSAGNGNKAFLGGSIESHGFIAIPVTVEGDSIDNKNYVLSGGESYFRNAVYFSEDVRILIDVPSKRMRISRISRCGDLSQDYDIHSRLIQKSDGVFSLAKALNNECPIVATIKLPKKLQKRQDILLDTSNRRVGYYRYDDDEDTYFEKEIRPLDVINGQVVSCYSGRVAYYLPWKKGLIANILQYEENMLVIRFDNNGLRCIQAACYSDKNNERYKAIFKEENTFDNEIWVEEDDDFLTAGVQK